MLTLKIEMMMNGVLSYDRRQRMQEIIWWFDPTMILLYHQVYMGPIKKEDALVQVQT